ncbi:endonuclease domain-containing protein [Taklimakanibacter deserti]|uniref:endonuclease domain-containing protein n=1 Tax=Taklimakanibacter deserti TaxID=2267839 RepID=UPI000E64EC54
MNNEAFDRVFDAQARHFRDNYIFAMASRANRCESPIEQLFLFALMAFWVSEYFQFPKVDEAPGGESLTVKCQHQIDGYRVDFALESGECPGIKLVVECDGHEFHERTKEQAARDRSRDRRLQSKGYIVLRFTGSELYRDAWKCASEVQAQIYSAHHNRSKGAA